MPNNKVMGIPTNHFELSSTMTVEVYFPNAVLDPDQEELLDDDVSEALENLDNVISEAIAKVHPDLRYRWV